MSSLYLGSHSSIENGFRGTSVVVPARQLNDADFEFGRLPIQKKATQQEENLLSTQNKPSFPDFEHRNAHNSQRIHGCHNPSYVQEDPPQSTSQPTNNDDEGDKEEDGDLCLEKKTMETRELKGICCDTQEEDNGDYAITTKIRNDNGEIFAILDSLKASTKQRDLHSGSRLHADIVRMGLLEHNVLVGNTLVNMYAKCGALEKAQDVFDKLPDRNVVSWTTLIAAYAQHGHNEEAWSCFERMQQGGISPNLVTFVCILKACACIGATKKGHMIHALIVEDGLLDQDIQIGTALVDMYAKCDLIMEAQLVFDELAVRDVVSWTALIIGYAQHGHGEKALHCFEQMQGEGFSPNEVTFTCALKACGSIEATHKGQQLHAQMVKEHFLEKDIVVGNVLIDMYAKCGALNEAQEVFDNLSIRNVVSWTSLIAGYVQHGHGEKALDCFIQMRLKGFSPNVVTLVCTLKACGSIGALDKGQELHAKIVREEMLEKNTMVGNALVDMYGKCGWVEKAQEVFGKLQDQDVVSWNSLISAYVQNGRDDEALCCMEQMQLDGFRPDAVTFVCMLKACGSLGAADKGKKLHVKIVREGLLEEKSMLVISLIDMYAKCGLLLEAQKVFDILPVRDTVSWNVLMAGYAQLGKEEIVFNLFDDMIGANTEPDSVTFTVVLNTCCHGGLLDKGQLYFKHIHTAYGIVPTLSHHTCIIDLLGRAGHLDKAVAIVEEMPFLPDYTMWHTLFSACQMWGNFKLGRVALGCTPQIDGNLAAAFVCLSNICAAPRWQEDADDIEC